MYLPSINANPSQYIDGYLTNKYNIGTAMRERSITNADNV